MGCWNFTTSSFDGVGRTIRIHLFARVDKAEEQIRNNNNVRRHWSRDLEESAFSKVIIALMQRQIFPTIGLSWLLY